MKAELPDASAYAKKCARACVCGVGGGKYVCAHVSGTPAGLWKHTWVFRVEVSTLRHRHGSHTPWHIPLRSDKRCVCV